MVVLVLFMAGDQLPAILLFEIVGNAGIIAPEQIGVTGVKVGVIPDFTVSVREAVVAQEPVIGVNVYVVVAVLSNAGDQLPEIPLFELVGKGCNIVPGHTSFGGVKIGVIGVFIVTGTAVLALSTPPTVCET